MPTDVGFEGRGLSQLRRLHRLAQIMGYDSLGTTMVYVRGTQGDYIRRWRR